MLLLLLLMLLLLLLMLLLLSVGLYFPADDKGGIVMAKSVFQNDNVF